MTHPYGFQQPGFYGHGQGLSQYAVPGLYAAHHVDDMIRRSDTTNRGGMQSNRIANEGGHFNAPSPSNAFMNFRPDVPFGHLHMGQAHLTAPVSEASATSSSIEPHITPFTTAQSHDHMMAPYPTESFSEFFDPDGHGNDEFQSSEQ
jgi:hypothetical protein